MKRKDYVYKRGEKLPFEIECEIADLTTKFLFRTCFPITFIISLHYIFYKQALQPIRYFEDYFFGVVLALLAAYMTGALLMLLITVFVRIGFNMFDKNLDCFLASKIYKE